MNNLIVLRSVKDYQVEDLLDANMGWIKSNFDTILLESVSCEKVNQVAVESLENVCGTYQLNLNTLIGKVPNLTPDRTAVWQSPYQSGDLPAFLDRRIEVLKLVFDGIPREQQTGLEILNQLLSQLKTIKLCRKALAEGIEIRGCGPANYYPTRHSLEERQQGFITNIRNCAAAGHRVFAAFTLAHGVPLITALMENPPKTVFAHLNVDPAFYNVEDTFNAWKRTHPAGLVTVQVPADQVQHYQLADHLKNEK